MTSPHQLNTLALLLFSSVAVAVPPTLPRDSGLPSGLLLRETQQAPVKPKPTTDAGIENTIEVPRLPMQADDQLKLSVQYFALHGNSQVSNAELQGLLSKYKHHPIGFNDLQAAANDISEFYRKLGYIIAYAYIPEQKIKNNRVDIEILEGQLDGSHLDGKHIAFIGDTRINKSVLQDFLNTQKAGQVVTEQDLTRMSLLLNDLSGIDSKVVLAPGAKTGTSALSLKVKEAPLISGYVSADNHGLYSTGYYRFDTGLNINDPLGLGDQLSLRFQSTETAASVAGWADYSIPLNGYGTRLAVNFSELHYELGRNFKTLNANGIARTTGASLSHPLYLSRDARLTAIAHYEHRWMHDNVNAFDTHNDRELNVMNFALAGSLYDKLLTGGLTQAYLSVSTGEVYFTDSAAARADELSNLNSNGGYHKFFWQLNRTQQLFADTWGSISVYANFAGQVASKNLDSSEQMSLGGPNAIRAYPVGEASADEAWLVNSEIRYGLPSFAGLAGQIQLLGFLDTGGARINARPLAGDVHNYRHLTGYGFGINWLGLEGFNIRTSLAWRDVNKQPLSDPNQSAPQAYFQVSKSF